MEYPHRTAENDKASEIHQNVLPGDNKGTANVDNDNASGGECGAEWMTGFGRVPSLPPSVYPPNDNIQNGNGDKASRDNID
jgi:hypothetical protein